MKQRVKLSLWIILAMLLFGWWYWFKYNFSQFSGNSVWNQDSSFWVPHFKTGYDGKGNDILKIRQGVMITQGNVVSADGSSMDQGSTGTLWFTVFIFDVNQMSTLYTSTTLKFFVQSPKIKEFLIFN